MQQWGALRRSSLFKVSSIGLLVLIMLIPVSMVRSVIDDRRAVGGAATRDIMQSWGQPQLIGGPVLSVPYRIVNVVPYGDRKEISGWVRFLPRELSIDGDVVSDIRYRGLHEVPVYTANLDISGFFAPPDVSGLGLDEAEFDWDRAWLALPVADARAILNSPSVSIADGEYRFATSGIQIPGFPPQVAASAAALSDIAARAESISFKITLSIGGTGTLKFIPGGDVTEVALRSNWDSPSFTGSWLPLSREISDDGFTARWQVSSLGRALPSRWLAFSEENLLAGIASFGVNFYLPVNSYQLTDRATKYAVMFIGLTFVVYFLFEVLIAIRLHPIHYLLVGFANTLFYLLLLSLSEHIGFGGAYLLSAGASIGLIGGYSSTILSGWQRAGLVVAMLVCLYGFLYLMLQAETYAMLAGAIGLWISLALIMFLTRRIDWYRWGGTGNADVESTAGA